MRSPDKKLMAAMVKHLSKGSRSAAELVKLTGMTLRTVHRYLHYLRQAGWDVVRRDKAYLILLNNDLKKTT